MGLHMGLYDELLYKELGKHLIENLDTLPFDYTSIIQNRGLRALDEIRAVIQDDRLNDFDMVEAIVCIFEKYGIDAGCCHDFG